MLELQERHVPGRLVHYSAGIEPESLPMLGKHSVNVTHPQPRIEFLSQCKIFIIYLTIM